MLASNYEAKVSHWHSQQNIKALNMEELMSRQRGRRVQDEWTHRGPKSRKSKQFQLAPGVTRQTDGFGSRPVIVVFQESRPMQS